MWIVLEGLDGSGKTTTAGVLESRGWTYAHTGPPGEGGDFPALLTRWWYRRGETRMVWDRGHLGELYCGPVRRGTTLTAAASACLDALLIDREAEIWWLDPPPDRLTSPVPLMQRASERMHLMEACRASRVPVRRFPTATHAQAHAMEMAMPLSPDLVDPHGAGGRRPMWWVVGEQASRAAVCNLPFTTPAGMDMLWPHLDPRRIRVTNALGPDEHLADARRGKFSDAALELLCTSWRALREPRVLTLGGTAEAAVRAAGIPVTETMRHPQYVRRFYHAEVPRWAEDFRRITA